jgi:hypothetical protein
VFVPDALVYFRPRSNLRAFFLQYYRYARGDGKAGLWPRRHAIRYLTYTFGPGLAAWAWAHPRNPIARAMPAFLLLAAAAYCRGPYARLLPMLKGLPLASVLYAISLVPLIRLTGDIAKMAGYPVGVWWRLRRGLRTED